MVDNGKSNEWLRLVAFLAFFCIFFCGLLNHFYFNRFELASDYLEYYEIYNYPDLNLGAFGGEIVAPFLFYSSKLLGIDYYGFGLVFGVLWVGPIYLISKSVRTELLIFYYMFFLLFFINMYFFLFRQFLSFLFIIYFLFSRNRARIAFFVLAVFSHFSGILFYFFARLKFSKQWIYYFMSTAAILAFCLNAIDFGMSKYLLFIMDLDFASYDIRRKLNIVARATTDTDGMGIKMFFILALAVVSHTFFIHKDQKKYSLLRLMYFSAVFAMIFSDFKILSNRVGFAAYYFSFPYLILVFSELIGSARLEKANYSIA